MIILLIAISLSLSTFLFLNTERFGKHPSGERLAKIKKSVNYRNGSFQNINETPMLTEDVSYGKVLYDFFIHSKPKEPNNIPSVKTNLKTLNNNENVVIWMGHSSYFIQLDGKKFLIDPVFSGNASPLSFTTKAYKGTDVYAVDDIPEIDFLFITHDHWDHMDYKTLKHLKPKINKVITGLGNGAHLEYWGYNPSSIIEGDWYDSFKINNNLSIHITPARHFSGRGFKRNQTLWASFVIQTSSTKIYLGGDSGYDEHFKDIGKKFGPFDLVILENGQYDESWKYIHMLPGEQFKAADDLNSKTILPVHYGKFTLANHDWKEPMEKMNDRANYEKINVLTPMIGEKVIVNDSIIKYKQWWKN